MTFNEYFGDWKKVIDTEELNKVLKQINSLYSKSNCAPDYKNIFKVFTTTPYNSLKQIWLLQDPYPQKGIATGLALANKIGTKKLSPSLEVIKESIINYEMPHNYINFVPDLEEWSKQGILLLNTALTVEINKPGSHSYIWREFIKKLLINLSMYQPGLIYILWGNSAKSFSSYINKNNHIYKRNHPSWYARNNIKIPYNFFTQLNQKTKWLFGEEIMWYKEIKY